MEKYLKLRKEWLVANDLRSRALFPSINDTDGFLSGNRIRTIKKVVEDDIGVEFQLRTCRRTYGQLLCDDDVDIESVSVSMGHHSTKTTEGYYCRKNEKKAIKSITEA
jgi:integrase